MEPENLVLAYKGYPSASMITFILHLAESKLKLMENESKTKRRIINILVEILQNIHHHQGKYIAFDFNVFVFFLFRNSVEYLIVTGNFIQKKKAAKLRDLINSYTTLTNTELKEIYRETLGNGHFSSKGGAGLGLMDVFRKSGGNINPRLISVSDDYFFFLMEIKIKKDHNGKFFDERHLKNTNDKAERPEWRDGDFREIHS